MSNPFVGEIRMFGGNFAPAGWAFCSGQMMPISENETLFNLIGTTYGGDGQSTFALPDLMGRLPIHMGSNPSSGTTWQIGERTGTESVTLTTQQIPSHNHALLGTSAAGTATDPTNRRLGTAPIYTDAGGTPVLLSAQSVGAAGGSQPHENLQPYLCVSFIISLFGIFPSQT